MGAAIVGVVGTSLGAVLGAVLGFLGQSLKAKQERKSAIEDARRQSYAEFMTSISASYARAKAHEGDPEETDLLRATSVIELIADEKISGQARWLQEEITKAHARVRQAKSKAEKEAADEEVRRVNHYRLELVKLFQDDLEISTEDRSVSSPLMGPSDPLGQATEPNGFSKIDPPDSPVEAPYDYLISADGFPAPTYWVVCGDLPPGLALDTNGKLHGKPTTPGRYTFSVAASNPAGLIVCPDVKIMVSQPPFRRPRHMRRAGGPPG